MEIRACMALLLAGLMLAACAPKVVRGPGLPTPSPGSRGHAAEIERLRSRVADSKAPAPPETYLDLAMLYVDHENPKPDYRLALKDLDSYSVLDPAGARSREVRNWIAVLRRLEALEGEAAELRRQGEEKDKALERARKEAQEARKEAQEARRNGEALVRENGDLAEIVKQLRKENQEMKETILKLKALDIELEELRKKTRP
jgi:hypothetical protein